MPSLPQKTAITAQLYRHLLAFVLTDVAQTASYGE